MWTKVTDIISRLVRGPDLGALSVAKALGTELTPTLDSPFARHYRAELRGGPFREVELRVIPPTGVSFLVLTADPDSPVAVHREGLVRFGRPKWRSLEPKSPPDGSVAECFNVGDKELRIGYEAESRLLQSVSLGFPPEPVAGE